MELVLKGKECLKIVKERRIVRTCKNDHLVEKEFNPNRNNQVFCSNICADRQGKSSWKKRNL